MSIEIPSGHKMFGVNAGYCRSNHLDKLWYYVIAPNKIAARIKFRKRITWLTIYKINKLSNEDASAIIAEQEQSILDGGFKHIIF